MVVLIACVTCAKAKAKCDKKIPCGRCVAKRIQCRPRGDRRFSDGQTELSLADIEMMAAAANGGTSGIQTPNLSRRPSMGTPSLSKRQSRQTTPHLTPQSKAQLSTPINVPWPATTLFSPRRMEQEIKVPVSPANLWGLKYNPSPEHNPMLNDIDPSTIHKSGPLFDSYLTLDSDSLQTDIDLPDLDMSMFPDFALPLGESPSFGSLNDLHIGNNVNAFHVARTMSNDTLPSLSRDSSSDVSSVGNSRTIDEHDHVAEVVETWPAFRCNPLKSPILCPPSSGIYLDGLFDLLKNHETWSSWICRSHLATAIPAGALTVESFDDVSREKLTAVTQNFLSHASDVHKARSMNGLHFKTTQDSGYMILPPANTLRCFLNAYVRHFETYNSCCSGDTLRPSWLLHQSDANLSTLLVLLMLAYGAAFDSTSEARCLSTGLIEVCRISWQNVVERDLRSTRDPTALLSGLLLTTLQAWSGDKTFMEMAMGRRDSFINMMRQAGFFEAHASAVSDLRQQPTIDAAWEQWKLDENKSRLAYAWVALDQEISLFYDTAPLASISDLKTPLPSSRDLWQARSATEWWNRYERQQESSQPPKASLRELFRAFVEEDGSHNAKLDATELRLLLHPLQGIINHSRQFSRCFNDEEVPGKAFRMRTKSMALARQDEIKILLHNWYQLACNSMDSSSTMCANLINFHLISLNALIDFSELERAIRGDPREDITILSSFPRLIQRGEMGEILMHCGQVLKNIRSISVDFRPHWWAGAHYRVALIAWAVSMARLHLEKESRDQSASPSELFAIDALAPEHPSVMLFVQQQDGIPAFSGSDGSLISLLSPKKLLAYFADSLEEDLSTRLTNGTRNKLQRLAGRWDSATG